MEAHADSRRRPRARTPILEIALRGLWVMPAWCATAAAFPGPGEHLGGREGAGELVNRQLGAMAALAAWVSGVMPRDQIKYNRPMPVLLHQRVCSLSAMKCVALLLLLLASCTPHTQDLCQPCVGRGGPDQGNCRDGMFCHVYDSCVGRGTDCNGHCSKACSSDADCPSPFTCIGSATPENGGSRICAVPLTTCPLDRG